MPTSEEIAARIKELDEIQKKKIEKAVNEEKRILIEKYKKEEYIRPDGTKSNLWDEAVSFWKSPAGKKAIRGHEHLLELPKKDN